MQLYLPQFRGAYKRPGIPLRFNGAHPLAPYLVFAIPMFEGGGAPNIYWGPSAPQSKPQFTVAATAGWTSDPLSGAATSFNSTRFETPQVSVFAGLNALSLVGRFRLVSNSVAFAEVMKKNNEVIVRMSQPQLQVFINGGNGFNGATGGTPTLGLAFSWGSSWVAGGVINLYTQVEGSAMQSTTSSATTGPIQSSVTSALVLGETDGGSGENLVGNQHFIYAFATALTATQLKAIWDDPTQFWIYPEDDLFAELVGVVGSTTITLAKASWNWVGNAVVEKQNFLAANKAWNWNGQAPALSANMTAASKAWNWSANAPAVQQTILAVKKAWAWVANASTLQAALGTVKRAWVWLGNPLTQFGPSGSTIKQLYVVLASLAALIAFSSALK